MFESRLSGVGKFLYSMTEVWLGIPKCLHQWSVLMMNILGSDKQNIYNDDILIILFDNQFS